MNDISRPSTINDHASNNDNNSNNSNNTQDHSVISHPRTKALINISDLVPYKDHPFKLYEGERLKDMVESIKANGIISSPIVRNHPSQNGKYEILSGHNRIRVAKEIGYTEVSCEVIGGLTEEDARLIVFESNYMQRDGFSEEFTPSEKAHAIASYYNAVKRQGRRTDLISEIRSVVENADKPLEIKENTASPLLVEKRDARAIVAERFGMKGNIERYLRINELTVDFKKMIDNENLSISAGYSISFLKAEQQCKLYTYITENHRNISMKQAEQLKQLAQSQKLNDKTLEQVFEGKKTKPSKPKKTVNIKYKRTQLESFPFFNEDTTDEAISETIIEALKLLEHYKKYGQLPNAPAITPQASQASQYPQASEPPRNEQADEAETPTEIDSEDDDEIFANVLEAVSFMQRD